MAEASLHDIQRDRDARFAEDQTGSSGPADFGDPQAEYKAAQSSAAFFDFSQRTQIEITGADRAKFLHNFCTNDINRLTPVQGCEAFVTNVKGRILAHIFVFATNNSLWLETVPDAEAALLAHLDRYVITEDVTLEGRTADCGELFITGPLAASRLGALGIDISSLQPFEHCPSGAFDFPLFVRRADMIGESGYLLSVPRVWVVELWNTLTNAGIPAAGFDAFHALRIEAGFPLYGLDLSEENLAQEAGRTEQAISFTKGCYLGQEPIARIDALGHVNRQMCGLQLASGSIPAPGNPVLTLEGDKEIGHVTSSALSFADDLPVALALLRSQFAADGTAVSMRDGEELLRATVYRPD